MRKYILFFVGIIAVLTIRDGLQARAQNVSRLLPQLKYPILGKCSGLEELDLYRIDVVDFAGDPRPDIVDIWSNRYKGQMNRLIDDYIQNALSEVECTESNGVFLPPTPEMADLARKLPPWEDPDDFATLALDDFSAVTLEYLRTYECALAERSFGLMSEVATELSFVTLSFTPFTTVIWEDTIDEYLDQQQKIERELDVRRRTVNRVLNLLGGMGRLQALEAEAVCLQRLSIDARNAVGLSAEAASCLPRVWDIRDPLRDYDDEE